MPGEQIIRTDEQNMKEGNVLFNDALNTFYLQLYGDKHIVKGHSDNERENPLPPHGLRFPMNKTRTDKTQKNVY